MHVLTDTDAILNQPPRVDALRRAVETVADAVTPAIEAYRPYVEGLENLPRDGRFLLVGNHTQVSVEALLIPFHVRRVIGKRVRSLTDRQFGRMRGPARDLLAAAGALVGAPEPVRELMCRNEPILVFPGGGREIPKFKGRSTPCAGRAAPDSPASQSNTSIRSCPSGWSVAMTSTGV